MSTIAKTLESSVYTPDGLRTLVKEAADQGFDSAVDDYISVEIDAYHNMSITWTEEL